MNRGNNIDTTMENTLQSFIDKNKDSTFAEINLAIKDKEISQAIAKLKWGNSPGHDQILNWGEKGLYLLWE